MILRIALASYKAFVLWFTLMPRLEDVGTDSLAWQVLGVLHSWGVPTSFGYLELEFVANIALFVPLGVLVALTVPRRRWWLCAIVGFALSCAIELTQLLWLPDRVADVRDVVANTLGATLGAGLVLGMRAIRWRSLNREDDHV